MNEDESSFIYWKGKIQYLGKGFFGWQRQLGKATIQGEIEKVLKKVFQCSITVTGSGRTDTRVNALGQVISFATPIIDRRKLIYTLNCLLPQSISVLSLERVNKEFNARFSAVAKTYIYLLRHQLGKTPFYSDISYCSHIPLDKEKMKRASEIFLGEKNFSSLQINNGDKVNPIKTILCCEYIKLFNGWEAIVLTSFGFMYKMVRALVGLLFCIGWGKLSLLEVKRIIDNQEPYSIKYLAEAQGLFLFDVYYSQEELELFLELVKNGDLAKLIEDRRW